MAANLDILSHIGDGHEGRIAATASPGILLMRGLLGGSGAGLEEAAQLAGGEVAAAQLRLAAHGLDADGGVVVVGGDEASVPALAEDTAEGGQHAVSRAGPVILLEQGADLEHVRPAQALPGHGLGRVHLG
jgi:hypothetical protein